MPTIPSDATAGDTVLATEWNQVLAALRLAAAGNTVGVMDIYFGATAPDGALLCTGKTIGNASSGGTARANADMETLFTHLWNETTNTEFVIQDSSGTPTTRGANAAADFAANKRMPLPDMRGRDAKGKDNMGGSSANRITDAAADVLGGASGTTDGSHSHSTVGSSSITAPNGSGYFLLSANPTPTSSNNSVSPFLTVNFIIWTGVDW